MQVAGAGCYSGGSGDPFHGIGCLCLATGEHAPIGRHIEKGCSNGKVNELYSSRLKDTQIQVGFLLRFYKELV